MLGQEAVLLLILGISSAVGAWAALVLYPRHAHTLDQNYPPHGSLARKIATFPVSDGRLDSPRALNNAMASGIFAIFFAVFAFGRLAWMVAAAVANAVRGHG